MMDELEKAMDELVKAVKRLKRSIIAVVIITGLYAGVMAFVALTRLGVF